MTHPGQPPLRPDHLADPGGTVLRPAGPPPEPAYEPVTDGTVLRPAGPPSYEQVTEGTVLRPAGPAAAATPRPPGELPDGAYTSPPTYRTPPSYAPQRTYQPEPSTPPSATPPSYVPSVPQATAPPAATSATTATPTASGSNAWDAWGATSLTPPPPGSWQAPAAPSYDLNDGTIVAPQLNVPAPNFGMPSADQARFSPPEERPGVPDLQPPTERFAPKPIPGGPLDLPQGGRYAAPAAEAPEGTRKRRRVPGWLVGAVGVLVLGLIGGGVWWRFFRPVVIDVPVAVNTSSAPVNKAKVTKPEDAVLGYLQALKDGDIAKALSYGPVGPGSQVLLTPAAMKESRSLAPIDNIVVPPVTAGTSVVKARYTIGTEAVERNFNVARTDDNGWQLAKSTTTVQLSAKRSSRVPLIINKVTVENVAVLELVPGVYHFETGLPYLRYLATTDIKVQSLDYNEPIQVLSLELTDAGRAAVLGQAQASMKACLDQPTLNPPNCPFGFTAPQPVKSIKWTQKKDPWPGVQFTLTKEDPAVAEANFTISLNAAVEFANGNKSDLNTYEGEVRLTADVAKTRPQDIVVKWSEARR